MSKETGAASVLIDLSDGVIKVIHGTDDVVLARKTDTEEGDWNRLWNFLENDLGVKREVLG